MTARVGTLWRCVRFQRSTQWGRACERGGGGRSSNSDLRESIEEHVGCRGRLHCDRHAAVSNCLQQRVNRESWDRRRVCHAHFEGASGTSRRGRRSRWGSRGGQRQGLFVEMTSSAAVQGARSRLVHLLLAFIDVARWSSCAGLRSHVARGCRTNSRGLHRVTPAAVTTRTARSMQKSTGSRRKVGRSCWEERSQVDSTRKSRLARR